MYNLGYTDALIKLGFEEKISGRLADMANAMGATSTGGSRVLRTPNPVKLKAVPDIFNVTPKHSPIADTIVSKINPTKLKTNNRLLTGLLLGGGAAAATGGGLLLHKYLKSRKPTEAPVPEYPEYDYVPNEFVYGDPYGEY